jgi:hypothetical protein
MMTWSRGDVMHTGAAHRHAGGVDPLARGGRVALKAGCLHEATDWVGRQPEILFHGDLGRVLDPTGIAAKDLGETSRRRGGRGANLALTSHVDVCTLQVAPIAAAARKNRDATSARTSGGAGQTLLV